MKHHLGTALTMMGLVSLAGSWTEAQTAQPIPANIPATQPSEAVGAGTAGGQETGGQGGGLGTAGRNATGNGATGNSTTGNGAMGRGAGRGAAGRGPAGRAAPATQSVSPRDALPWTPADYNSLKPALPSLIIAGDSTADRGSDALHRGWAAALIDYFDTSKINVVNLARGGRSSRSFIHEGLWDKLLTGVKPGDIVMLQFGHNDGGDINNANGRPGLPGTGDETRSVTRADGSTEVVHTFGWYTRKFIQDIKNKGATPIVMGATPYNRWVNGAFVNKPGDMSVWGQQVAAEQKVLFLDHTAAISQRDEQLGEAATGLLYNADHLHTTTFGAIVNAESFVSVVKGTHIQALVNALNDKGRRLPAFTPSATAATQPTAIMQP